MSLPAKLGLALLLILPAAHPLVPLEVVPTRTLWWIHVVPVAVLAYEHGVTGTVVGIVWSGFLCFTTEQLLGPGLVGSIDVSVLRDVVTPLLFTELLVAGLGLYGRRAAEQLRHSATHDQLTGLPNRRLLLDRVAQRIRRAGREGWPSFAVLFIDMDDFKLLNESLGHGPANELLVRFARRLRLAVREADTVARWGGDEFVVVLDEIDATEDAVRVARRIHASLESPVEARGQRVQLRSSIGVAVGADPHTEAEELLGRADTAMYRAKRKGKNGIAVYEAGDREGSRSRLVLETDLRGALERGEFIFHYQPIVRADDGSLAGFESLIRWRHPENGILPPSRFIPVAEETGLVVPLGEFVCMEACKILARWGRQHPEREGVFLSVNLSPRQLAQAGFAKRLTDLCASNGVDPRRLKLELTETSLLEADEPTRRSLDALQEAGFQLALDDFGTGYSSLSHLNRFPLSYLKVDRTFVAGIGDRERNKKILQAVVALSTQLGYETVAEGVETARQTARARYLGCDLLQGFHVSRPLPLSDAEGLLSRHGRVEEAGDAEVRAG
jgi:diguanylate cyclase (GGDEF)-like protein